MRPILESLAKYMISNRGPELGNDTIILPNRRAGLFLQQHLARYSHDVQWSPKIFSINDFISEISILENPDPISQLFFLYDIYNECIDNPDTFDEFYFWGEIMLRDFDEMDKYLVDADMLFTNIIDLKDIEEPLAGLDEEQLQFIRRFWSGFHEGNLTPEKEKFLDICKLLPRLYHGLREMLGSMDMGYQGMQYREIVDRIDRNGLEFPIRGKVFIAGFNALNGCEKRIFSWLKDQGAEFFWDYDHAYLADTVSEAGRFLRDNLVLFPETVKLEEFRGLEGEKQIRIFELPTDVLQVKTVHKILERSGSQAAENYTDIAVILCDEELLMPVVMSLPESFKEINVTMGYPLKNTPVYSLIDDLLRLQTNIRQTKDGRISFYHKDVTSILLHPYLRETDNQMDHPILDEIAANNLIYVEGGLFEGEAYGKIFRKADSPVELVTYLRVVVLQILENISGHLDLMHRDLDREFVFQSLINLNKLEMLVKDRPAVTIPILIRLLRKMISDLRVPFEGEPLSGLQLMGILETRLLDFRHVILLSMNEEVMPGSSISQSYIPYSMRLGYNMPAREDKDAIYAYYFNRLLQRAEKIDLLYNSRSEGVQTGEMSRYLYQIIYQYRTKVIRPGMEVMAVESPSLVIPHTAEVEKKLEKFKIGNSEEKYLSPSAINTFMDCSLKFYLRYLAGIGEPEEVLEEIDAAGFGTVVHEAIRILYSEISDQEKGIISANALETLGTSNHPEVVLKKVFIDHHFKGRKNSTIEGRNIIIFRVMLKYLLKIIETDIQFTPFRLISAESSHTREMEIELGGRLVGVRLGGKIDRIDRVGDSVRVIDYKTGDASRGFPDVESLFDAGLRSRNPAAFQTLFYAWLVQKDYPGEKVTPGLYVMKALYEKEFDPGLMEGSRNQRTRVTSFREIEVDFESRLKNVLQHLYNPEVPFEQTGIESRCRNCDYAGICSRNLIE